ncbi:hypothetical protein CY34DRAFT_740388 [Suillus luteus UH-Slu-Lm8-n1]|uniref:Uncharacterized protein n=1 Tax=Suillus luteus UH-Slu-Lm8-n1 TaxID=930992 RepID=A0A0D0BIP3_9AGAM|nr:hypothetical protein CY34DRAFT_740388 [Suillus luteus UH-Slu-Lm8-n1]
MFWDEQNKIKYCSTNVSTPPTPMPDTLSFKTLPPSSRLRVRGGSRASTPSVSSGYCTKARERCAKRLCSRPHRGAFYAVRFKRMYLSLPIGRMICSWALTEICSWAWFEAV